MLHTLSKALSKPAAVDKVRKKHFNLILRLFCNIYSSEIIFMYCISIWSEEP